MTIKRAILFSLRLDNGLAHIGVVSDGFAREMTPLVIHNIGAGAQEDVLFSWRMAGTIGILLNKTFPHMKKKIQILFTRTVLFSDGSPAHNDTIPLPSTAPGFSLSTPGAKKTGNGTSVLKLAILDA